MTLVGPGGVGKTRLALRAATELQRSVQDGVWLVELAGLGDAELVTKTVMTSVGLCDEIHLTMAVTPPGAVLTWIGDDL